MAEATLKSVITLAKSPLAMGTSRAATQALVSGVVAIGLIIAETTHAHQILELLVAMVHTVCRHRTSDTHSGAADEPSGHTQTECLLGEAFFLFVNAVRLELGSPRRAITFRGDRLGLEYIADFGYLGIGVLLLSCLASCQAT